ncbi:MAG: hypothetical protein HOJ21_14580 [Alphaproteobacteria bacterium]|nr:hypothetical protein [Alphaproteobacteria bacterium]
MSRIVARLAGAGLILAFGMSAHASPKGYDVDRLLRQPTPDWLHAPASPPQYQAAPPAYAPQPLDRIPRMPAPAVLPEEGALTVPPPLPVYQAPPPQTSPLQTSPLQTAPAARQVIRAPGSPRSTVSGAWSPRR